MTQNRPKPHTTPRDASCGPRLKSRREKQGTPAAPPVTLAEVYRVLTLERVRQAVMARFKARGGDLSRWARRDREAMADALTYTEDEEELRQKCHMTPVRLALREVRRRLEWELWP
jgi:hypothetical protein